MPKISFYQTPFQTTSKDQIDFIEYLNGIKNGQWQDVVLSIRAEKNEATKKAKKTKSPAVTASGYFSESRNAAKLTTHSGILCIDCDAKDNPNILDIRAEFGGDEFIYSFHTSISGSGLAIYFKINPNKHLESFLAIEKYLLENYHIISDASCKDVSRLRYVSYDPDLYTNHAAKKWATYLQKESIAPINYNPIFSKNDIDYCIDQLEKKGLDITGSYYDWIKVGFALACEFGENGRFYFHKVSRLNDKYDQQKTEKKFDNFLKSNSNKTQIGTFFWLCKNTGIQIKSEKTQVIEKVARVRRQSIGKSGGSPNDQSAKDSTFQYLKDIEKISKEDAIEIIDKVYELSEKELNTTDKDNELLYIIEYINSLGTAYNIIKDRAEIKGEPVTDKISNSITLNLKELFPKSKITKDLVESILNSDRVKEYHPFEQFIEKNKHLRPKGNFDKLISCFNLPFDDWSEQLPIFIERWLISLVASMFGNVSVLTLVFTGEFGTNKTRFWRNLLPMELQDYYAESKLDDGKDSEFLMCENLLIVDDEFSGKSKKDFSRFKELSSISKVTKRRAYGRHNESRNRYAVLGGNSNLDDILNDPTGNRRIIPVKVKSIDFDKFQQIDKVELLLEMYNKWKLTGIHWLTKEENITLDTMTKGFTEITMEEDLILSLFKPSNLHDIRAEFVTSTVMLNECEMKLTKQRLYHKTFGQILKKLGFNRIKKNGIYGYLINRLYQ